MSAPIYPGVSIQVGERTLVVPRLSLRQMQVLREQILRIETKGASGIAQQVDDVLDVSFAAVGRNHPDITRDELGDLLDLGNVAQILRAAIAGKLGEATKGEAGPDSA